MFTGIIQEKGKFLAKSKNEHKYQLKIKAKKVLANLKKGDSIAVNGVCLTVVNFGDNYFKADIMPETLRATNLSDLEKGAILNLEQSLKANGFIGGHFVTGHVDSTAVVKSTKKKTNAQIIKMEVDSETEKLIVKKGSAALNGVSLTVMEIKNGILTISLIPETWSETNLANLSLGDKVNIETDILGKYVYQILGNSNNKQAEKNKISKSFLAENGFI